MGFELNFIYKEKNDEELKNKKVKLGDINQEIGLDVVAGKIMGQLAKPNIEIVEVEVLEFVKKKVNCKINEKGIQLGAKRFNFDDGEVIANALKEEVVQPPQANNTPTKNNHIDMILPKRNQPIRYEIYRPAPDLLKQDKAKGYSFTVGKKYPIFEEKPLGNDDRYGNVYVVEDDKKKRVTISTMQFVPATIMQLQQDDDIVQESSGNLIWENVVEENVVDLRRGM